MKKLLLLLAALSIQTTAAAQTSQQKLPSDLSYSFAELRFVDVDTSGGDGFRLAGSYELDGQWILVGALTALDFNDNVDSTLLEIGGGYVWNYSDDFDLVSTLRLVRAEVDRPGGDADDSGFAFSAGARGFLAPQFEIRGSVNHINLDNSDTYLQLAGDYYFTDQISAGVSLDIAGDTDSFSLGVRWYFR
ncbi:MAG: porin family protein [Gammaproteobacteria bacterium]|nr:porin family protein [Gammaproteobacteria bacterium]MDH3805792.1 porin family protein [Gammaproteobacteria bacterium]